MRGALMAASAAARRFSAGGSKGCHDRDISKNKLQ